MNNFFCNYKTQKANQEHTVSDIDLNMNNFFCDHTTHPVDPEHVFSEIDLNYRRDYSKGKSFRVSIWNNVDTYNNDDFIQDFVVYDRTLWARIDSTPSTNEIPSEGKWAKIIEGVSDIEFEERDGKVYWKYEDEAEWKLLFSGVSSDYVKKEELIKINGQQIYDGEDITIEINEGVSENILISEDILVQDGPLSKLLIDAGIEKIKKGMNLQELFVSLFCHEVWPEIQSNKGTIRPSTSMEVSVYSDKTGLVLPGTQITFTAKRSDLPAPSTTNSIVSGFTYGYSESKEGEKKTGNIKKQWTVRETDNEYEMSLSCGNYKTLPTDKTTDSITIQAQVGQNTCTANASGTAKYSASIDAIPSYYIISSLGNKEDKHKSDPVSEDSKQVICSAASDAQSTVTCAYPCYSNVNGTQLSNTATTQYHQDTNIFTISSVPATSETKPFIFEFPKSHKITSFTKKFLHNKYKCYTNINNQGDKLTNSANSEITFDVLSKGITVPSEVTSQQHFMLYFVSELENPTIEVQDASGKWNGLNNKVYEIEKNSKQIDGVSYDKFTTIGNSSGPAIYRFIFKQKSEESDDNYTISPFDKQFGDAKYEYNRLCTTGTSGIVDITIKFDKKMTKE